MKPADASPISQLMDSLRSRITRSQVAYWMIQSGVPLTADSFIDMHRSDDGSLAENAFDANDFALLDILRKLERTGWDGKTGFEDDAPIL